MVALQILSKILASKDVSILDDNFLTVEYFVGYEAEYNFIVGHNRNYGSVPDKATFLAKFPDLELLEVTESDKYLVDTIREEYLYYKSVPVVQKVAELLKTDANAAAEYMIHSLKDIQPNYRLGGTDIVADINTRYDEYIQRRDFQDTWFITTGFPELDGIIHGLQRGEDLTVLVARVNQGKSWVLEKMCTHIWQIGFNVGYISPEMGAMSVGYRFDTLYQHFSNLDLMRGRKTLDEESYKSYMDDLKKNDKKFMVATPMDFQQRITISKLRNWVKQYNLDVLAIDGITYLADERGKRGDTKTIALTNVAEDLMQLSIEMKIPVLVVVQANRNGAYGDDEDTTPELESIRDSDGISHNASTVISMRQLKNHVLRLEIKKQRFGPVGGRLDYTWDIDSGNFVFIPSDGDAQPEEETEEKVRNLRRRYKNDKDVVF